MTSPLRILTPLGWIAAILAVVLAISAVSSVWTGFWSWLPWSTQSQLERADARAERAETAAATEAARATGAAEIARSVERHYHTIERVTVEAGRAESEIRSLPDAETPVDPDRVRVLRDADRGLCRVAPAICTDIDAP